MTENGFNSAASRVDPFKKLKIADNDFLNQIEGRSPCPECRKSRKFFCYSCYVPVERLNGALPNVELPIAIDIIKHKNETDGKSTAVHAAILAPKYVTVYEYPTIPDYSMEDGVVLIFPSHKSTNVYSLFSQNVQLKKRPLPKGHNMGTLLKNLAIECQASEGNETEAETDGLPIKKAVFIDSTWNQSRSIYKDERISSMRSVVLQNRLSQFWRHQKDSPRWYLATIEAIHQFLIELHINAWGMYETYEGFDNLGLNMNAICDKYKGLCRNNLGAAPYNGQYDNLLFFFTHMYKLIHTYYDHNKLKAYKRPIN
ncbi:tRNA-uridine aminocarboxypropyltransferase 1 [Pseudolycoriella hygida]|uniref:tRNA-uridine aminocarboxypropyltransferase 1 n=1 Tax=Pseudolycoriella hygida TaxID=35572 RepID=A0A9Q0MTH3_9DIPT|nr:tRNA-uridine aminocarboxypropyltransferase 1 [Pseudolycoriella hygida]